MYDRLPYPAADYHICPCCSTEFGNDDAEFSYEQLREMWVAGGANWFFGRAPEGWNPWKQLIDAQFGSYVPGFPFTELRVRADARIQASRIIGLAEPYVVVAAA